MSNDPHRCACPRRSALACRNSVLGLSIALLSLGLPGRVLAAPEPIECGPHFGDLTLGSGQTLDCDLNVIGGSALVEADAVIDGSLNVLTGSARILGQVTGDVTAARDLAITGQVGGNAFAIGGDAEVAGEVGGKVTTARGDIHLAPEAHVGGTVSARGEVRLDSGARADAEVVAGEGVTVEPGALVAGDVRERDSASGYSAVQGDGSRQGGWLRALLLGAFLVLAMLFAGLTQLALPEQIDRIAGTAAASPGKLLLLGLIALLVTPFSWILLVTIPLSALTLALGWVGMALTWGRAVAPRRGPTMQAALGGLLLAALMTLLVTLLTAFPSIPVFCGVSLLLALPLAWAYAAALASRLGTRPPAWSVPPAAEEPRAVAPVAPPAPPASVDPAPGQPPVVHPPAVTPSAPPAESDDLPAAELRAPTAPAPLAPVLAEHDEPAAGLPATGERAGPSGALEVPSPPAEAGGLPPGAAPAPPPSDVAADEPAFDETRHGPPLRHVIGLSPIYAELLRGAGVLGAKDLAGLSPDEVARLTQAPGVMAVGPEKAAAWIRAARGLLAGSL